MNTLLIITLACILIAAAICYVVFYRGNPLAKPIDPTKSRAYYASRFNPSKVYYTSGVRGYSEINELVGVDKNSLRIIHHNYARDKFQVYFKHSVIDVDVRSFYVDHLNIPKDTRYVYYMDVVSDGQAFARVIEGADPSWYERIKDRPFWGKDQAQYFYKNKKLNVEYKSFVFINDVWAKDKDSVYQLNDEGLRRVDLDVTRLSLLNEHYVQDGKRVFYNGLMLGEDDPRGIQLNGFNCNSDEPIEVMSENHIRHAGKVYYCGLETDIDASTFKPFLKAGVLFHGFSKDKNYVYKYSKKITHIDVASFRLNGETMRDKYNRYDADGDIFGSPFQG